MVTKDFVELPDGARMARAPVTLAELGEFLRTENYFNSAWWDVAAPSDHQDAGDAVLLRIEFQWEKRSQPVRRVSWFEASAYCRWRGGRLPSFEQRRALPENHLVHGALPEWCDDRCANNAQLRRTAHHYERCVAPDSKHLRLGFRLVLPPAQRRRTAR